MEDRQTGRRSQTSLDGWSIAAALGLMAAAFLIERLGPTDRNGGQPDSSKVLPSRTKRDALPPAWPRKAKTVAAKPTSPAEIPAKGWRHRGPDG
ncbi:hypothetical protein [Bradyrhizobium pachyrhizi]|uniref:hypothetical protein n=1 Tax=Bradyrhizobium pachyrhizi TaxID=280333 RepID=UPI00128F1183|nr:hypothetical protein [Bradyrhizobium pachyrhizi]